MLIIEDSKIYITKGDDATLNVEIALVQDSDEMLQPITPNDFLTLTVRELPKLDSPVLLEVSSAPGSTQIVLTHNITSAIEVGQYSADIQLYTADGRRITVWPTPSGRERYLETNNKVFIVMPEVTGK